MNTTIKLLSTISATLMTALGSVSHAAAILDFTMRADTWDWTGAGTLGYQFSVTNTVVIDALGVFDIDNDGLLGSHDVGIWTSDGNLLVTTTVSPSATLTLPSVSGLGSFVFESIPELALVAGDYRIGAVYQWSADVVSFDSQGMFTNNSSIGYSHNHWFNLDNTTLSFPDAQYPDPTNRMYFGPIARTVVPEPSKALLLGLGISAFSLRRDRGH